MGGAGICAQPEGKGVHSGHKETELERVLCWG